jgi:hypothetical protein
MATSYLTDMFGYEEPIQYVKLYQLPGQPAVAPVVMAGGRSLKFAPSARRLSSSINGQELPQDVLQLIKRINTMVSGDHSWDSASNSTVHTPKSDDCWSG